MEEPPEPPYASAHVLWKWARTHWGEVDGVLLLRSGGVGGLSRLSLSEVLNVTHAYLGDSIGSAAVARVLTTAGEQAAAEEDEDHSSVAVANENAESIKGLMSMVKGL